MTKPRQYGAGIVDVMYRSINLRRRLWYLGPVYIRDEEGPHPEPDYGLDILPSLSRHHDNNRHNAFVPHCLCHGHDVILFTVKRAFHKFRFHILNLL